MVLFLTVLASPFFQQGEGIFENSYFQEESNYEDENGGDINFLSYGNTKNPSGKIIAISQDPSEEPTDDETDVKNSVQNEENDEDPDAKDSLKQISADMEKEFGEMRMIQLADSIAGDMGMVMKIKLAK